MSSGQSKTDIAKQLKEIVDKYETPTTAMNILSTQDKNIIQMYSSQLKRIRDDCRKELELLLQGGWSVEDLISLFNSHSARLDNAIKNLEVGERPEKEEVEGYDVVDNYVEALRDYLHAIVDLFGLRGFVDILVRNYIKEHMPK